VADEVKPGNAGIVVKFRCFRRKPRRMGLDRSPQTSVAPVDGAKPRSLQCAPQRLEQHGVRSVPMHQNDSFAGHSGRLARARERHPWGCVNRVTVRAAGFAIVERV